MNNENKMSMYKSVKVFLVHCDCGGAIQGPLNTIPLFATRRQALDFIAMSQMEQDDEHKATISDVSLLVPNDLLRDQEEENG